MSTHPRFTFAPMFSRIQTIARELAQLTQRPHTADLVALVREYIHEAQQAGILPLRASGELTEGDLNLLYEFLHYQTILASYASQNQARDIYAEAHGHIARAATAATPDKVYMHLQLASTAVEMLSVGVRKAEADAARQAEALATMPVASEVENPLAEDAYAAPSRKRTSPYRDALVALAGAKRGSVLRFESNSALTQIKTQAKKLRYKILVAENEGKLYVQIIDTGADK